MLGKLVRSQDVGIMCSQDAFQLLGHVCRVCRRLLGLHGMYTIIEVLQLSEDALVPRNRIYQEWGCPRTQHWMASVDH